jgi:hypothetical protein
MGAAPRSRMLDHRGREAGPYEGKFKGPTRKTDVLGTRLSYDALLLIIVVD